MGGAVDQIPVVDVVRVLQVGFVYQPFLLFVIDFVSINQRQDAEEALLVVGRLKERKQPGDLQMAVLLHELSNDGNANTQELVTSAVLANSRLEKSSRLIDIFGVAAGPDNSMHFPFCWRFFNSLSLTPHYAPGPGSLCST